MNNYNDKYAQYSRMSVYIRTKNYSDFQFISELSPKFCKENAHVRGRQVYYNDLLSLLSYPLQANNYLNWGEVLQVKKYEADKPQIESLLPEPQKPQEPLEPIYDDLDPRALKISNKPLYPKPDFKIQFLRNSAPKAAPLVEGLVIYLGKLWYSYKSWKWDKRTSEIEALKKTSKKYQPYKQKLDSYNQDLTNYQRAYSIWKNKRDEFEIKLNEALSVWSLEKENFDNAVGVEHEQLIKLKRDYENREKLAIEAVVKAILLRSPYPDSFPRQCDVNYDEESKIIIIDFQLPDFERLEIVEESKRFDLKPIAKNKRKSIVESTLPAIAIRTLYEIASTHEVDTIASIVFNGWVNFIDKTNGNEVCGCILSVHADIDDIKKLIITHVDPKECFKSLKGVVAKNILEYIPIAPILVINKKDNRIVEGREVIEGLSPDHNLAAMDWNDFEHLIRELFEKEFSKHGAEVKITHASHDRGVDAIIYDPDPIRGGKFIIQAKRYTKLVDVSAVRDLYGAIQNENANRGILVTTSHYGPDAYEFAKDKNITLLTGENLLHLLEKHGYKFKIDIKEARKLLNLK